MTTTRSRTLRLLHDPALTGSVNMGRDEALLERVDAGESPPTLRFYGWDPPTVSLGYFQPCAQFEALSPPAGELAVVRRPTGGGAILHDQELTYSIALPLDHPLLACGPNCLYESMHSALVRVLADATIDTHLCGTSDDSGAGKGPFFCFARRHKFDVMLGADKLAGSAQRRTRHAVLQHGSIIIDSRYAQQPVATVASLSATQLADSIAGEFSGVHDLTLEIGIWTAEELVRAQHHQEKHESKAWIERV